MSKQPHALNYDDHCLSLLAGLENLQRLLAGNGKVVLRPAEASEARIFLAAVARSLIVPPRSPGGRVEVLDHLVGHRHELLMLRAATADPEPPMAA